MFIFEIIYIYVQFIKVSVLLLEMLSLVLLLQTDSAFAAYLRCLFLLFLQLLQALFLPQKEKEILEVQDLVIVK